MPLLLERPDLATEPEVPIELLTGLVQILANAVAQLPLPMSPILVAGVAEDLGSVALLEAV